MARSGLLHTVSCFIFVFGAFFPVFAQEITSRTLAAPLYTPPTTSGGQPIQMTDPSLAEPIVQTPLIYGTPGAMTVPPTGLVLSGSPTTPLPLPGQYVYPQTATVKRTYLQPEVDYEWTYSRMKTTGYHVVKKINPWTGSVTTFYQPQEIQSLLPWPHQKEVVRYKEVTIDVPVAPMVTAPPMVQTVPVMNTTSYVPVTSLPTTVISDIADTVPSIPLQTSSYPSSIQQASGSVVITPTEVEKQPVATTPGTETTSPVIAPSTFSKQTTARPITAENSGQAEETISTKPRLSKYDNPLAPKSNQSTLPEKLFESR